MASYRKLPGRRRGLVFGSSLWLAPDHLLLVRSSRFSEDYRRFYLRDIQAVVMTRTARFHVPAWVWFAPLLLLVLTPFVIAGSIPMWVVAAAAALLLAWWLFVSLTRSCVCRLYTAVSSEELPSLCRLRPARKALAILEERIAAVQGAMPVDWAEQAAASPLSVAARRSLAQNLDTAPVRTWASLALVILLFADAALTAYSGQRRDTGLVLANSALLIAEAACIIAVMLQHYRGKLHRSMRNFAIVVVLVLGAAIYIQMFGQALSPRPGASPEERQVISDMRNAFNAARIAQAYAVVSLGLGIAGLLLSFGRNPEPRTE